MVLIRVLSRLVTVKHNNKIRFYNLCSEAKYNGPPVGVSWTVKCFPMKHGQPPEFKTITGEWMTSC